MRLVMTPSWREQGANRVDPGLPLLLLAATLVGIAIAGDGTMARTINGLGGLSWLAAAALLGWSVRADPRRFRNGAVTLGATIVLAVAVRPTDLVAAVVGFSVAGALVAVVARERPQPWVLLVPALWLPVHVLTRVGARVLRDGAAAVRTDPPPTAALVPLAMVVAAAIGGLIVERWVRASDSSRRAVVDAPAD